MSRFEIYTFIMQHQNETKQHHHHHRPLRVDFSLFVNQSPSKNKAHFLITTGKAHTEKSQSKTKKGTQISTERDDICFVFISVSFRPPQIYYFSIALAHSAYALSPQNAHQNAFEIFCVIDFIPRLLPQKKTKDIL